MRNLKNKPSRKISDIEWFVLFLVSPFIFWKAEKIYENSLGENISMLILSAAGVLLFCVAGAKLKFFNIFIIIRRLPKRLIGIFKQLRSDLKWWQLHESRIIQNETIEDKEKMDML